MTMVDHHALCQSTNSYYCQQNFEQHNHFYNSDTNGNAFGEICWLHRTVGISYII